MALSCPLSVREAVVVAQFWIRIHDVMQIVALILPVTLFTAAFCQLLRLADNQLQESGPRRPFPVGSCMLAALAIWTMCAVVVVGLLPGGTGPVQYAASNSVATFIFNQRGATILAMLVGPAISAVVGLVCSRRSPTRWHWLLTAVILYGLAWGVLFANLWFWPRV